MIFEYGCTKAVLTSKIKNEKLNKYNTKTNGE